MSREPREFLCKFFLAGVNFYRFNAENWHFRQILREKVAFFGVNFILQKFCPCKKNDKYQVCGHPHQPDHPDHPHHPDCPSHPGHGILTVQSKGSDMPSTTWSTLVFPSESFMTLCICHWKQFQYPTSGDKCLSPGIFSHNCLEFL